MVVRANQLISLTITEPWQETILADEHPFHRSGGDSTRCDTDQTIGARSEHAPEGADATRLALHAQADVCVASAELQDLTRRLILELHPAK
jgi:hypothetical protein